MGKTTQNSTSCMRGATNSHAQNTYDLENVKLQGLIDWVSITFDKDYYTTDFVITLLLKYFDLPFFSNINEVEEGGTRWEFGKIKEPGYSKSMSYGNISIFYDDYGNVDKGIKLSFSGQGVRQAELLFRDEYNWLDFFKEVMKFNVNITRLDLAIDDYYGYFNVKDLIDLASNGRMVTKFKKWKPDGDHDTVTGECLAHSMYIGSRSSRLFFRIYEKGKQLGLDKFWNRTEVQLENERALHAVNWIIENEDRHIGELVAGILRQYIKFCDMDQTDSNRSRWTVADFWTTFLHDIEPIRLSEALPQSDIPAKLNWADRQLKKTLAMLYLAYKDNREESNIIEKLVYKGILNLETKDIRLIEKYKEDKKRADEKYHRHKENETIEL